jgi:hypothetical protein
MKIKKVTLIAILIGIAGLVIIIHTVLAWDPQPVEDDHNLFIPGTQPEDVSIFDSPDNCKNCHGGDDEGTEIDYNWRSSMMAQAARDPLWFASITVAGQDSIWALGNPNAVDLCIRCHSPTGWLEGRSDPTNTSILTGDDYWGVQCDFCHSMIDPFAQLGQVDVAVDTDPMAISLAQNTTLRDIMVLLNHTMFNGRPFLNSSTHLPVYYNNGFLPNYVESGGGQFFIDTSSAKRGPLFDTSPPHDFNYSRYHKSKSFCSPCHDVSNPVLASVFIGEDAPETMAASSYFHVERTNSEFLLSIYGSGGANSDIAGIGWADSCQDCHMRDVTGKASIFPSSPIRSDLPLHDFSGGNQWIQKILASADQSSSAYDSYNYEILSGAKYEGAQIDVAGIQGYGGQLLAGSQKSKNQLKEAANLSLENETTNVISLVVKNNAGHKLISGFPEGRRMFLNIKFFNASGYLLGEINPYEPLVVQKDIFGNEMYISGGNLTKTHNKMVWECEMSSTLTGENKTFHFVLGSDRYKDNRIPPKGFNTSAMYTRIIQPRWEGEDAPDYFTAEEYAGGYDRLSIEKPNGTAYWNATLYYQTTSKEYIEFLRDEINGDGGTLQGTGVGGDPPYLIQTDPFFSNLKGWGNAIWDLWLHNKGSSPIVMDSYNRLPSSDIDLDSDGLSDVWELLWFGNLSEIPEGDYDKDELTNLAEYENATIPTNSDSDGDRMPDLWEIENLLNPNNDDSQDDADSDGLSNLAEFWNSTNPNNDDTDDDGMPDLWEVENLLDPNIDDSQNDTDSDGLTNLAEFQNATDPRNDDTDGDGLPDLWELNHALNPTNDDANSDDDIDGLSNIAEFLNNTNPKLNDTDSDGMPDGWEVENHLNPTANDAEEDPDGDGFTNLKEYQEQTDPNDRKDHPKGEEKEDSFLENNIWIIAIIIIIIVLILIMLLRKNKSKDVSEAKEEEESNKL